MGMLTIDFYIGVVKYAFCAFTAACLVAFLYSFVEQMFPNVLLSRTMVSYRGPKVKLGILLVALGVIGALTTIVMATSGSFADNVVVGYAFFGISAILIQIGAFTYLTSEVRQERAA